MNNSNSFEPIKTVKGVGNIIKPPCLGKIRLGYMKKKGETAYPFETDYFVCPQEVENIYGKEPRELKIWVPSENIEDVIPYAYEYYGKSGLKCIGNGSYARRKNENNQWILHENCPCDLLKQKVCNLQGHFRVILYEVSCAGIYLINTRSARSINDIKSGLLYVKDLVGRFAFVPCVLRRVETIIPRNGKKEKHFTLQLFLEDLTPQEIDTYRKDSQRALAFASQCQLPEHEIMSPRYEASDSIAYEDEELQSTTNHVDQTPPPITENKDPQSIPENKDPSEPASEKTSNNSGTLPSRNTEGQSDLSIKDKISKLQCQALEGTLRFNKIQVEELCILYSINRIADLSAVQLDEARQWIIEEGKNRV